MYLAGDVLTTSKATPPPPPPCYKPTPATAQAVTHNIRYAGQYFDAETNLFDNWNRTYNPQTGRYTQNDPIGLEGGWNRYGYVGGNALSFNDPMGLQAEMCRAGLSSWCPPPSDLKPLGEKWREWAEAPACKAFTECMRDSAFGGMNGDNGAQGAFCFYIGIRTYLNPPNK